MEKNIKKIIVVLVMIVCIMVQGCGPKDITASKEVPMGRYIEEELPIKIEINSSPEDPYPTEIYSQGMLKTKDDKLQLYISNEEYEMYEKEEMGSFKKIEVPWIEKLGENDFNMGHSMTSDEQGNIYFDNANSDLGSTIIKVTGQELRSIKMAWQGGDNYRQPRSMWILKNGDILLFEHKMGIERYSLSDGRFIRNYPGKPSKLMVMDNKIYQINNEESKIEVVDLDTGNTERSIPCENIDESTIIAAGDDGAVYLAGQFGIKRLTKEGTIWELIVDGALTSFGMPSLECKAMQIVKDAIIIRFDKSEGGMALKKYTYSKDTPTTPDKEIIAYSLKDSNSLRQIAAWYQLSHTDTKITVQVGIDKDSTLTEADAIKALNTELMAGNGPDLILLDGLNVGTYIEKGILADLSSWAKNTEEVKECLENIITVYKEQDKMYALPVNFTAPMLWGDKNITEHVKNIEDLAAYKGTHPSGTLISYKTPEELIYKFGPTSSQAWFNDNEELQEDHIINFLEAVKILQKQGKKPEDAELVSLEELKISDCNLDDALDVAYGYADVQFIKPAGMKDLLTGAVTNKQRKNCDFTMLSDQSRSVFEPKNVLGVNAASKKQDIARDIMQMAVSEVTQDIDTGVGLPVNRLSFEKWMQGKGLDKGWGCMTSSKRDGKDCRLMVQWGLEGYEKEMKRYYEECKKLQVPIKASPTLLKIVLDESKGYFEGTMTVQEAEKGIKEKIEFYLAE